MQKTLLILAIFLVAAFARTSDDTYRMLWNAWKNVHDKFYSGAEEVARFAIFIDNYEHIVKFNAESDSVQLGLNQFSDLTPTEFKSLHTGCYTEQDREVDQETLFEHSGIEVPDNFDWRQKGAVTGVKNQGQCGSCWAFSTTGALEGYYAVHHGGLQSFSEQQLVDCDGSDAGCNGGYPGNAFNYFAKNGVAQEGSYPYTAKKGSCRYSGGGAKVNSGYANIASNNRDAVKAAVATQGPVSVGIEADQSVFQSYKSGVIKSGCGNNRDHAVLIVGYGSNSGTDAWIVKNSWGGSWGQGGYVYLATDPSQNGGAGVCGILGTPMIPK